MRQKIDTFFASPNRYAVFIIFLLSVALLFWYAPQTHGPESLFNTAIFRAEVKEVIVEGDFTRINGAVLERQELIISVFRGEEIEEARLVNDYIPLAEGDAIYVQKSLFESRYELSNIDRSKGLIILAAVFALLVIGVGGVYGWNSLVGLVFSLAVILKFLIPAILGGANPITAGLLGALSILIVAIYVSHGFNRKSCSAIIGIAGALMVAGFLAVYSADALRLTGFTEESIYLNFAGGGTLNFLGLLVAGVLIAAIGVLDDVAITQASTVFALASAGEHLRGAKLFKKAMVVGKDHIAAVVNTLVLAYVGAGLPTILLFTFNQYPFSFAASSEILAVEIVRTLVASIGLVLAVPLTTLVATAFVKKTRFEGNDGESYDTAKDLAHTH